MSKGAFFLDSCIIFLVFSCGEEYCPDLLDTIPGGLMNKKKSVPKKLTGPLEVSADGGIGVGGFLGFPLVQVGGQVGPILHILIAPSRRAAMVALRLRVP